MTTPRAPSSPNESADSPCELLPITVETVREIRSRTEWQRTVRIDSKLLAMLCDAAEQPNNAAQELRNLINAKRFDRDAFENDTAFADWALSRCRFTLDKLNAAERNIAPPVLSARPNEAQLMQFYSVDNLHDLIEMQAHHIERLQSRLPNNDQPIRTHVREG